MQLKWGIVGTGRICEDFCLALSTCDIKEHIIVAVSSREKIKADEFVKKCQLGNDIRTYGTQEEIFDDTNVDIIYIGTIEEYHRDLSIKALNKNKHVLCEKPLAMNTTEVQDIINAAKITKKFMMEAIWSRFFPIYNYLRDTLKDIGTVNYYREKLEFNLILFRLYLLNVHLIVVD
jgi:dihydrodiol dehydrogenase / D-xylose 1-dehydrogenase (NADP)